MLHGTACTMEILRKMSATLPAESSAKVLDLAERLERAGFTTAALLVPFFEEGVDSVLHAAFPDDVGFGKEVKEVVADFSKVLGGMADWEGRLSRQDLSLPNQFHPALKSV